MIEAEETPARRARGRTLGRTLGRILAAVVALVLLLAVLAFGAVQWLETDSGRAFAVRQLPLYKPASGLTVRVGRIEGSIFGKAIVHDMVLGDTRGDFAHIPLLQLDWRPLDLLRDTLTVRAAVVPEMRVLRGPSLNPSETFLPDFDFDIARLRIDRLVLEAPVAGTRRVGRVDGSIVIRAGRAKVDMIAVALADAGQPASGDAVRLKLDAEPDRDRFDMDAAITAPAGGAIAGILGLAQPLDVVLRGDGSWRVWQGQLVARFGGAPLADLALTGKSGLFTMVGDTMPARLASGTTAALLAPVLAVDASARVIDRTAEVRARLTSRALAITARGGVDLGGETIDDMIVDVRLLDPAVISPKLRLRDGRAAATINGTFGNALVDYRLSAAAATWGTTSATTIQVTGVLRTGQRPLAVPVDFGVARVTGLGPQVDPLLTNVRVDGTLALAGGRLTSNALRFRTDRGNGIATVAAGGGRDFVVTARAALPRYAMAGVGVADLGVDVRVVPAGAGVRVTGRADVKATRVDNDGARALLGGLPRLTTEFDLGPDLALVFRNARLTAPALSLTAGGSRSAGGILAIKGAGTARDYGAFTLAVAGPTPAPTIDFTAARPGLGVGLARVDGRAEPVSGGWSFAVDAGSDYGPVAARGLLRTTPAPLAVDLASVTVAGMRGSGRLVRTAAGPFAGRIDLTGPGLTGVAVLDGRGSVQHADVAASATNATLALATPVTIAGGTLRLDVLLAPGGPTANGRFDLTGIERDALRIARAEGVIAYADGRGTARASASGTGAGNVPFSGTASVAFAPQRIEVTASGRLDDKAIGFSGPLIVTRGVTAAGAPVWTLAPVSIVTADGRAELSGSFGDATAFRAKLDRVSLSLLGIFYPALDLSGRVSGTVDIAAPAGGVPTGTASLRLNSLSRVGIASASTPIDVGLNATLGAGGGIARAVIVRGGKVEGRAQARLGPIPAGGGSLTERLFASPLFAQLRYLGPAEALWGLAGIGAIDVRGPLSVVADAGGTLGAPQVTGTMRSEGARVESVLIGAVVDQASLEARFNNSRLELVRFSGRAGQGGSISGRGGITLSPEQGFPTDIRLNLKNARVLGRDDLSGTASGNLRIATDQYGGVLSGKLAVDRATYRIGRTATAEVPVLQVTEKNTQVLGRRIATYAPPQRWLLDLQVSAANRLFVSGMGLETEWRADLRVKGGATTPELIGRVELVRGDYDFAGKRFSLTRGDVRFQGGFPPDPVIDIVAESSSNGFTAQLQISGSAMTPEIRFSSVPAVPEDEVLSRILFGESVTNLSAPEAVQLAGALATLRGGGGGFNPINSVRKGLGIDRLRILPADQATGRRTAVAAGQYIGRNVYVELATDAQGYTATRIEVSLTRSFSILSEVATLGGTSVNLRWKRDY